MMRSQHANSSLRQWYRSRGLMPFDRLTFNPYNLKADRDYLMRLRKVGASRRKVDGYWHTEQRMSGCLRAVKRVLGDQNQELTLIDAGCGESPDCELAVKKLRFGMAIGVDLFSPFGKFGSGNRAYFRQGDITIYIGRPNSTDVVISQGVIDLLKPEERNPFYRNAWDTLKQGGLFVVLFATLARGWGYDIDNEKDQIKMSGFEYVVSTHSAYVFRKV